MSKRCSSFILFREVIKTSLGESTKTSHYREVRVLPVYETTVSNNSHLFFCKHCQNKQYLLFKMLAIVQRRIAEGDREKKCVFLFYLHFALGIDRNTYETILQRNGQGYCSSTTFFVNFLKTFCNRCSAPNGSQSEKSTLAGCKINMIERKTRRTLCIQWVCHGVPRGWERNSTTGRFGHVLFSIYIHSRT